jgi:type II secretory pathway pseudopilin PulG
MRSGERRLRREAGFTYLGLVIAVAIVGMAGAATLKVDALMRRAAAEQALLEAGAAFSAALKSYADATVNGQPAQPPSLQELLKDPRFPGVRRHLRKIFVDPITGKTEWGIVWRDPDSHSGVLAVYSPSRARPLKQANFDARFQNLENREHLSEWKFAALGQGVAQPAAAVPVAQPSLFAPPTAAPAPAQDASEAAPVPATEEAGENDGKDGE